jgi:hypothetical protein
VADSAIIGQTNLFTEIAEKFVLGLTKFEPDSSEFMNTQNVFNIHLGKVESMEFSMWLREAEALLSILSQTEHPSLGIRSRWFRRSLFQCR